MRGRRIGLEVGETRAGGGRGFAVEVACCSGHGGYDALLRLMTDIPALAFYAQDWRRWACVRSIGCVQHEDASRVVLFGISTPSYEKACKCYG